MISARPYNPCRASASHQNPVSPAIFQVPGSFLGPPDLLLMHLQGVSVGHFELEAGGVSVVEWQV